MKKISQETKIKVWKTLLIVFLLAAIVLAIYLPLKLSGALSKIDSAEKLKEVILEFGGYSYIIFFIVQFLQTTILPIPAAVTTVAGTLLFGPWITFAISFVAVFFGSLFAFFLGKKIGRKLVIWVAGEKQTLKWEEKMAKGKFVFFLMMLLPLFPDDILCIVVGTTNMSYRFFIITNLITRPISILTTCLLGSGTIIPFNGWGIPVWIVLAVMVLLLFFLSIKYNSQIEAFVVKLGQKIGIKKKEENLEPSPALNEETNTSTESETKTSDEHEINNDGEKNERSSEK